MTKRRKFYGWGYEGEGLDEQEIGALRRTVAARYGVAELAATPAPQLGEIALRPPRVSAPRSLAELCTTDPYERALHSYGKSYPDTVRALRRHYPNPPDLVAYPRDEEDVRRLLSWADENRVAVVPFGGGSSVVGGVEPDVGDSYPATLSLDLARLDRVLEVDKTSRAARIQAGAFGPELEAQLRPHQLTLRHFPQSFEMSTLGGWIATRSGGHFATLYTHIDDFVEGLRCVTPQGILETRRLPGSGAGPSPDRMVIGSEGILGVITEAWMRLQDRPRFRGSSAVRFDDFTRAAEAVRALSQSGLAPANCRLIDAQEALNTGAGDGRAALLVLAFESGDHDVSPWLLRALELVGDHGGRSEPAAAAAAPAHREGAAGAWRDAFLRAPYYREALAPLGIISDTFETAICWSEFPEFHRRVVERIRAVIEEVTGRPGSVTCRFTHVYPDGPAPYFTFQGLGERARALEQWREIKLAANDAVVSLGGTVTHHHAVGRDHRPHGYDEQRTPLFARALEAAKSALDPNGILNPGVLIDPRGRNLGRTGVFREA